MNSATIYQIVADTCGVVCFASGFAVSILVFWLYVIHSCQRG